MSDYTIQTNFIEAENILNDDIYVGNGFSPVYPGYALSVGNSGSSVSVMQSFLNAIKNGMFPSLNRLSVDGVFGENTRKTVMQYQGLAGLKADGIIGQLTWDSIVEDYNSLPGSGSDRYPGKALRQGSSGVDIGNMQVKLNRISPVYTAINYQIVDGVYGNNMANAVRRFQQMFGLVADGVIGETTWNKILQVYNGVVNGNNPAVVAEYPGYLLNTGSQGNSVRFVQSFLNYINEYYDYKWAPLTVDSRYGQHTKQIVAAFQSKYGIKSDGIVGAATWRKIIEELNRIL